MEKESLTNLLVELPSEVLEKARDSAQSLGLSFSDYMKALVDKDTTANRSDPWREPIPPDVNALWDEEIREFDTGKNANAHPSASSADELINLLHDDSETIVTDEGN